jgi:hypothetical protein
MRPQQILDEAARAQQATFENDTSAEIVRAPPADSSDAATKATEQTPYSNFRDKVAAMDLITALVEKRAAWQHKIDDLAEAIAILEKKSTGWQQDTDIW